MMTDVSKPTGSGGGASPPEDLVDLETAAKVTGVPTSTIRSWIRYGKVRSDWKRGYYNLISLAELQAHIAAVRMIRPTAPTVSQEGDQPDGQTQGQDNTSV